jgi:S-DNA-T family DNA segregation ATPase FtsK/SpoIIIE
MLRRELRPRSQSMPYVRFRAPNLHLPLKLLLAGWLFVLAAQVAWWFLWHPRTLAVTVLTTWLVLADAVLLACIVAAVLLCALAGWWMLDPDRFRTVVLQWVQLRLRWWLLYRRDWQPAMVTVGLALRESWGGTLPQLRSLRSDAGRDALRVRMLPGQTFEQWQATAPALAQTFGARQVRVRRVLNRPQELDLLVTRRRGARIHHVTERTVEVEPDQVTVARGAFPRQPRGGAE